MLNFFDQDFTQLTNSLAEIAQPAFRARQIWEAVYKNLVGSWQEMTNLSKDLREQLQSMYSLSSFSELDITHSLDGSSTRYLFQLVDGHLIESVILRSDERITLCISAQSGCPIGCAFCATGRMGFGRDLSSGEIVEQVIHLARILTHGSETITNIVMMGMGEPFLNYDATLSAIRRLNDEKGLRIGARRITVSTIGLPDKIRRFADENLQVNLAISLHAPNDALRALLVPLAHNVSISSILASCRHYTEHTHRRVTFEYVMIDNLNDQAVHARELAVLLAGMLCHVNLIGLNPTEHFTGCPSTNAVANEFGRILLKSNIPVSIRNSQGNDIQAACGQLAGKIITNQ